MKNPEAPAPPWAELGPERAAEFPKHLQERFEGRKFHDVDPPDFLDYEGAEILLIGAEAGIEELGIRLDPQRETLETAEIFNDLRMEKSEH
ncbi:MAG: hypothetical protein GWN71_32490, partial [Gammaproteobacteria bacterium]|nr:hypothetical protein [Gemmatimonadota bacterium]NIU78105.1 hypothetical protein [Gammaproteobacteria bacterium]